MSENINENINLSLKFYKDNNFKSSLECINKVIAKDQKSIKALGIRASIYEKTNSFDFFFFKPNLSLCLNLKITIAPAISTIATAS